MLKYTHLRDFKNYCLIKIYRFGLADMKNKLRDRKPMLASPSLPIKVDPLILIKLK